MHSESSAFSRLFASVLFDTLAHQGASLSPQSNIVLTRIAEGLRYFDAHAVALPGAAVMVRTAQLALLGDSIRLLDSQRLDIPEAIRAHCTDPQAVIPTFDELIAAQAHCLKTLAADRSTSSQNDDGFSALLQRSFEIEQSVREFIKDWTNEHADQYSRPSAEAAASVPTAMQLQALVDGSKKFGSVKILAIRQFFSHSSKHAFLVETNGGNAWPTQAVLRREPKYAIVDTSLPDEFEVLEVAHRAGLPVPAPLFAERDAQALDGRFILMSFVSGKTHTAQALGTAVVPVLRQCAEFLALLQQIDPRIVERMKRDAGEPWTNLLMRRIDGIYATWIRDRLASSALIEAAFGWLRIRAPTISAQWCIVHGDFDLRNILIEDQKISAVLDWETSRLGHRGEDLAYFKREISRNMPWPDFLRAYESAGMSPLADREIAFFDVLSWLWRTVVTITAFSGYYRAAHRDFFFATTRFVEYEDSLDGLATAIRTAPP